MVGSLRQLRCRRVRKSGFPQVVETVATQEADQRKPERLRVPSPEESVPMERRRFRLKNCVTFRSQCGLCSAGVSLVGTGCCWQVGFRIPASPTSFRSFGPGVGCDLVSSCWRQVTNTCQDECLMCSGTVPFIVTEMRAALSDTACRADSAVHADRLDSLKQV